MSERTFLGRAALVTGASSGIGRLIALRLAKAGMAQWLVGRSESGLAETAALIEQAGGVRPHCEVLDLAQRGSIAALVERIGQAHPHLYAIINNAGIMHPEPILSGRMDRWQAMFDVNVMAPLECCRAGIELMRRQGKPGRIVNVSSLAARFDAGGVYGASKLALDMIGRSLRSELEFDPIRITTIVPGGFVTQLARSLEPETIAGFAERARQKGFSFDGAVDERLLGDADHVAREVVHVLEQPITIDLQELVIRPPVSLEY